ncbi:TonB-dependent receptor [Ideonella sp. BN130291]|uniref:TonB-dependent receptor n=1 Tax=Ideonella sp. BN130291 TaxID=3112940 RepID=UPI002E25E731|nr:TonB-dependent receptor [Ideonella sp. BN130291]
MIPFKLTPICIACTLSALATAAWGQAATPAAAADNTVQTVEITGMRKSLRTTEEIKRDSIQVVDSINASDIGAFPDRSIGDALQRISGVQITRDLGETANVIIRGLPDVSTTVNGMEVFTGTGRRISYQDLPVMSVQGLDVYKSLTADILEGGIAGSVNVRLATPFTQGMGWQATAKAGARRLKPQGSSQSENYTDPAVGGSISNRTKTDAGEMGFLVDAYYQKDRFVYPVQWNDRPEQVWSVDANGNSTHVFRDQNGIFQPAAPGERLASAAFVGGIYNRGNRERASLHGAFQWKPSDKLEVSSHLLSMDYKNRFETDYIFSIVGWTPHATDVVVGTEGCLPNGNNPICPVISSTNPATRYGPNPWNVDPNTTTSTQAFRQKTRTNLATLGVAYREGPLRLNSDLAFSHSKYSNERIVVDQRVMDVTTRTYTVGPDGHGGFTSVTTPSSQTPLRDPSQFALLALVQNWNEDTGRQAQWKTDAEWALGDGFMRKVMGGVRLSERRAESQAANTFNDFPDDARPLASVAFGPNFDRLVPGVDRLLGPFMTPDMNYLLDNTDALRQGYGAPLGRAPADPLRSFSQRERNITAYVQGKFGFDVGSVSVLGNAGVRLIRVNRRLEGTLSTPPAQQGDPNVLSPLDMTTSETNVLPSLGLVASWTDRLQSHFTVGKTITRPTFADLNPALALTAATVNVPGAGSAGNPNLKPTKSISSDATLEYYFKKNGYVQVAVFDRRIDGYLQPFTDVENIGGENYYVTRPQNSRKGRLHGVEVGGQAFFDFLPGIWRNFGMQANYTLINGKNQTRTSLNSDTFIDSPLVDVSKHNYNLVLMYQGNGITGRLAATHRGAYADNVNDGDFHLVNTVRGATYVDLSLGYAITKNLSLQFDATNITHTKYESYIGDPSRPRDIRYTPSTYSLGVNFTL